MFHINKGQLFRALIKIMYSIYSETSPNGHLRIAVNFLGFNYEFSTNRNLRIADTSEQRTKCQRPRGPSIWRFRLNNYCIIQVTYMHIFTTTWVWHYKYTLVLPSIVLKKASAVPLYVGLSTQLLYYFYTCGLQSRAGDVKLTNNVKANGCGTVKFHDWAS